MIDFKKLVKIKWKEIEEKTIISYPEIEDLCHRSYSNHKKGCPNIDKCYHLNIPNFEIISEYGKYNHFYLIYAKFDFKQYKDLRKKEHSNWSEKQIKCVLYWQKSVKKILSEFINQQDLSNHGYILGCGTGLKIKNQDRVGSMENSCINVFSTCKLNGIKLEINPKNNIYLVCLLCSKKIIKFKVQRQLL